MTKAAQASPDSVSLFLQGTQLYIITLVNTHMSQHTILVNLSSRETREGGERERETGERGEGRGTEGEGEGEGEGLALASLQLPLLRGCCCSSAPPSWRSF